MRTGSLQTMRGVTVIFALFNLWTTCLGLNCKVVPGRLKQIDVGNGQVWGVNSNDQIYTLYSSGWTNIPGALRHVSVGPAGVWGVNSNNQIYKFVNGGWVNVGGLLKQIDAGGKLIVSGVNMNDDIYCLAEDSTMGYKGPGSPNPWVNIPGKLKYYSCGPYSCWGVNSANQIYIMKGVSPTACGGSLNWENIAGSLSMIEVSTDGKVYGVNYNGDIYYREGVTPCNPAGTGWTHIPHSKKIKHASYDLGHLWLIGTDDSIMDCTI